jgi:hypothetical protein
MQLVWNPAMKEYLVMNDVTMELWGDWRFSP